MTLNQVAPISSGPSDARYVDSRTIAQASSGPRLNSMLATCAMLIAASPRKIHSDTCG
jgi:hypothetical protein